jgi:ABC-type polysaccharide/polyol phosphate export permease
VGYSLDAIGAGVRPLYALVNPLAPVIDGYRRAVLEGLPPQWGLLALGAIGALTYLVVGYAVFKRLEGLSSSPGRSTPIACGSGSAPTG